MTPLAARSMRPDMKHDTQVKLDFKGDSRATATPDAIVQQRFSLGPNSAKLLLGAVACVYGTNYAC
eukprot:2501479-Prymnesium_polylepis.1